eukprot:g1987.t1
MMQDQTDDQAVLMLSQSKWMDETALDEQRQFLYLDAVDMFPPGSGGQRHPVVDQGSADEVLHHDPGFNSLADQRVANKLDQLLSDIERRVEAKEELYCIQNRVERSIIKYHSPTMPGPAKTNQNSREADVGDVEKFIHQVHKVASRKLGSPETQPLRDMQRVSDGIKDSKQVDPVNLGHRNRGLIGQRTLTHVPRAPSAPHELTIDLSSDEWLREHLESLDEMMASVRNAKSALQETHETVLHSTKNNGVHKQRQMPTKRIVRTRKNETRGKPTERKALEKARAELRKKQGLISGLKSALRESQLLIDKQAVKAKAMSEEIGALKRHVRRLQGSVVAKAHFESDAGADVQDEREDLVEELRELKKAYGTLENELFSAKQKLAATNPRILSPTRVKFGNTKLSKDEERQIRQQYQKYITEIEHNNAVAVRRLKSHVLRMECSSHHDRESQIKEVTTILTQQKERMLTAMHRQRKQFHAAIDNAESTIKSLRVDHAREIEALKNKWTKETEDTTAALRKQVEDTARIHDALVSKMKHRHDEEISSMKKKYKEKINSINDGTTNKLLNVLENKKTSARDADIFRIKIAEAQAKMAEQASISEEQRVKLANKSQVIIGLQYQISQVNAELSESKKNAQRLGIQIKALNELLDKVRTISNDSSNVILGGEQDMQLTLEEAQTIIATLGMRVLQLEQSLGHTKQKGSEATSQDEDENSWPKGFRQFERFSYMPKILVAPLINSNGVVTGGIILLNCQSVLTK